MPYSLEMWLKLLGKENDEMRRRYGLMPYALCCMPYALEKWRRYGAKEPY